jgi:hypothetical protein
MYEDSEMFGSSVTYKVAYNKQQPVLLKDVL